MSAITSNVGATILPFPAPAIAGERRRYSSIEAGLTAVPCLVRDDLSPFQQLAGMLVENRDRQSLTPIEEAVAVQQLAGMDGVTAKEITATTGIKTKEIRQSVTVASSEVGGHMRLPLRPDVGPKRRFGRV